MHSISTSVFEPTPPPTTTTLLSQSPLPGVGLGVMLIEGVGVIVGVIVGVTVTVGVIVGVGLPNTKAVENVLFVVFA